MIHFELKLTEIINLMLRPIDEFFLNKEEPIRSCLQYLRKHILNYKEDITETWRYGMPFYNYQGKRFCYLWVHKKYKQPYLGIVDGDKIDHPALIKENRSQMKILLINPDKNIPVKKINTILKEALLFS